MGRLTQEQWERARADYEVKGESMSAISREFGIDIAAISRKAKKEAWSQGKSQALVEKKINSIKQLAEIESESQGRIATKCKALA